jgi:hypothetical protein
MFKYQAFDLPDNAWWNSLIYRQANGFQPELAFAIWRFYMNMRRFIAFIGIEVKAEGKYSQYCWHFSSLLFLCRASQF